MGNNSYNKKENLFLIQNKGLSITELTLLFNKMFPKKVGKSESAIRNKIYKMNAISKKKRIKINTGGGLHDKHSRCNFTDDELEILTSDKSVMSKIVCYMKKYPDKKDMSPDTFKKWVRAAEEIKNTKKMKEDAKMKTNCVVPTSDEVSPVVENNNKLYNVIVNFGFKTGEKISLSKILKSMGGVFSEEKTIMAYLNGWGSYGKKYKTNMKYNGLLEKDPDGSFVYIGNKSDILTVKEVIPQNVLKCDEIKNNKSSSFVDQDRLMVEDHNLLVEQTTLLKELINLTQKTQDEQTNLFKELVSTINKNGLVNQYIEQSINRNSGINEKLYDMLKKLDDEQKERREKNKSI